MDSDSEGASGRPRPGCRCRAAYSVLQVVAGPGPGGKPQAVTCSTSLSSTLPVGEAFQAAGKPRLRSAAIASASDSVNSIIMMFGPSHSVPINPGHVVVSFVTDSEPRQLPVTQ